MSTNDVSQQLAVIRSMVERTRRETAESGRFFVWLGVVALVGVVAIATLEQIGRNTLVLPTLIGITVLSGIVGYATLARPRSRSGIRSYATTVSTFAWTACGIATVIVAFVFPLVGAYDWNLVPILTCVILGIGVFSTGAIFEIAPVAWCAFAWWGAAVGMVFVHGTPRAAIMACAIGLGWVLPGILFGRTSEGRRSDA